MKNQINQTVKTAVVFLIFAISSKTFGDIHYVDQNNSTPSAPYTNWNTAALTIQTAIDEPLTINGDIVLVTNGIYNSGETYSANSSATNRVVITKNIILKSVNGPAATVICGSASPLTGGTGTGAVCGVYIRSGTLSGFTVSNGFSPAATSGAFNQQDCGAGVWTDNNATITNCVISDNTALSLGGGICSLSPNTIVDSIISNNYVIDSDSWAGGIYCSESTVENCLIIRNSSTNCGGIYLDSSSMMLNSVISENRASKYGGVFIDAGSTGQCCQILKNTATDSVGGIYNDDGFVLSCLVAGNSATNEVGGIYNNSGGGVRISECTIVDNTASNCGGVYMGTGLMLNSIIYYNTAATNANFTKITGSTINYSCTFPIDGLAPNCITNEPLFVNRSINDFHLFSDSSCINTGMNLFVNYDFDLDGVQRLLAEKVDLGCYEQSKNPSIEPPSITFPISILPAGIGITTVTNMENITVSGTKSSTDSVVVPNGLGGWITNGINQVIVGTNWENVTDVVGSFFGQTNIINYGGADNDTSETSTNKTVLKVINYYNPYCKITDPSTDITVAGNVSHYMVRANGGKGITNIIFKDAIGTESGRQITKTSFENSCALSFGANEITAAAKYFFGNGLSATVNIMRTGAADFQPPVLTVLSPFDYWITNIPTVEIIAKAYDANGIYSVKFDSQQGNYIGQSNFIGNISLAENTNEIIVVAEDNAGNPSTNFHHVIIDTIMPDIIIYNPEAEIKVVEGNVAAYTVRAFADDNYGVIDVSFLTNGAFFGKADIHNGTNYEKRINLTFNTNIISVVARDIANNVKTNTVRIVRKTSGSGDFTPPTTTITEPATSPIIVHSNWYCVRGTAVDSSGICSGLFENTKGPEYYSALTITSSWLSSDIQLFPKTNSIIMRAWDNADNLGQSSTKLIIYDLTPFVQITSSVSIVGYEVSSVNIAGTNNGFVTGPIWWTNTLNNTFGTEIGSPWIASVPLAEGLNTIIVTGSNIWNEIASDTTTIFRISNPFINITNVPTIVAYNQPTESISGTNVNIFGQLWMVTDRHPETTNWFAQGFSTTVNNLEHGNNVITVFGTNSYNLQTNASVNIYRETLDDILPFIDITNLPAIVPYPQTTAEITGTNLNIAGQLGVVTDRHPETTNWFAQGFSTTVINLEQGNNVITIFGTNSYNLQTNDTVNIYRETLDDILPFIDITNTLVIVPYLQTTAEISGTNLNIAGQLGLVTDRHPETTNWFAQGFGTTVINLEYGTNVITVFGTNSYNLQTNDIVNIYRETLDDVRPFIDIINSPTVVAALQTTAEISGTNLNITGQLGLVNDTHPETTNWFAQGFSTTVINLEPGNNLITVFGTNSYNFSTNATVNIYRETLDDVRPFIDITNLPAIVTYPQTTAEISGTNLSIYGQLWLVTDRHPETTNWFAQGFSTTVINLEHGTNVITVFGTNSYNFSTNDAVNIYRETLDDAGPFIDITNAPAIVPYLQTTAEISGTNLNIDGQLGIVTDRHPETTNWFDQGFSTTVINLEHGNNLITVLGTNSYNLHTNDSVNIYRETLDDVAPFIDITNTFAIVPYPQTTAEINGTNLNVDGQLGIVTDRHPETTNWFAQGFSTTVINLEHGNNLITVFGTNSYNFQTNDTVSIYRETWEEVRPFIDITNTLAIVPYPQTTAEISGTNLNIDGQLGLVTDRHPETTNWFAQGFSTTVINLEQGNNVITVFGTNSYNFQTNEIVNIYCETLDDISPFINITNTLAIVPYLQTTAEISGTNLNISGQLGLVSDRHPETTNWFAQGFSTTITNLEQGNNVITVFGTNSYNFLTNEIVNIYRETWEEVKPFIDITNTPTIVPYPQIIEISGTNLNIVGNMTWSNSLVEGETTFMPTGDTFAVNITNLIIGDNEIFVFGTNEFGSVSDSITIRTVPLIIVIQNPLDATTSQVQNITISGNVFGDFVTNVTVNTETAIGSNNWCVDINLVTGDNLIEAIAISGDNVATDTIHVVYDSSAPVDTNPPIIIIQSPLDGTTSQVQNVTIKGIANDNINLSNVTVNGVTAKGLKNWLINFNLIAGDNLIEAIATDNSGNATTTTINIVYAPLPPVVTITAPNGGSNYFVKIGEHSTNIFGTVVEAADEPIIWSNSLNNTGGSVPAGNSFAISNIFLALGDNIVEVYATLAGFRSTNSITITVIDKKPNIEVTSPTNWTTYSVTQSVNITGIATDDEGVVAITRNGINIFSQYSYPDWTDSLFLNHGTNTYTYIAIDAEGLAATDIVNYVVADLFSPYIEVLDPPDWTTYLSPTNIWVAGIATDNVAVVSITRNGTDITSDYSAPNWTNVISAELLERGTNIFNYIAYDGDSLSTTATVRYIVLSNTVYSTPVQVLETWPRYIANDQVGTVEFISNRNTIWKLFVVNDANTNILIASGNCTQGWNLVEFYGGDLPFTDSEVENPLQLVVGKDSNQEILSAFSATVVEDLNEFGTASDDFDGDQIFVQYKGSGKIDIKGRTINIENGAAKDKLTIKVKAAKGTGDGVAAICGIFSDGNIKMIKHAGDLDRLQIDGVMSKLMIAGGNLGRSNGTVRYNVKFNSLGTKSKSSITLKAGKNKSDKTTIMANCFANILVGELKSEPNTVESLAGLKTLKISGGNLGVDNINIENTCRHWISAKYASIIMVKPVKKTIGGNVFDYSFYFTDEDKPTKGSFNKFFFNGVTDSSDNNNVTIVCGYDDSINPIEITGTNWIGQDVNYGFGKITTKTGLQGTVVIKNWGKGKTKQVKGADTARWIVDGKAE